MAIAIISRGKQAGRRITILTWPASIGRDAASTIAIDDSRASRYHARIKKRDRLYVIEDLQSKNGTYLNGDKISNSVIHSGDKILVGDTEIVFMTPEAQIDMTHQFSEFEPLMDLPDTDELGGPIELAQTNHSDNGQASRRLDVEISLRPADLSRELLEKIYEVQANIVGQEQIPDTCSSLLRGLHHLDSSISRSVIFLWTASSRKLIPVASKHTAATAAFSFNKRAFESTLARKIGVILGSAAAAGINAGSYKVILPMIQHGEILCLLQLEYDRPQMPPTNESLAPLRFLIEQVAPSIDSLILRRDLEHYSVGMIEAMIAAIEAKDTYTHGHSERVSRYSMAIADEMNLDRSVKRLLLMSSLCHDIGKIGIPDAILRKASLLNPDEYEEMKQHPVIGANIVANLPNARRFLSGIKHHHEKWDGTGYPDGLVGEDIPFFGRIVAVADVFDAMVSGRSYSGFIDESEAVEKLSSEQDLFDPDIVRAFVRAWESGGLTQKTSTQKNKIPGDQDP
jgi:HD-GYP domain-containing protein (c-di-GMP phosphodiesterase class II)